MENYFETLPYEMHDEIFYYIRDVDSVENFYSLIKKCNEEFFERMMFPKLDEIGESGTKLNVINADYISIDNFLMFYLIHNRDIVKSEGNKYYRIGGMSEMFPKYARDYKLKACEDQATKTFISGSYAITRFINHVKYLGYKGKLPLFETNDIEFILFIFK